MKQYPHFLKIKSIFIMVGLLVMVFLTGCRLIKHKHYAKYGAPNTYYKKMSNTDFISQANNEDNYKC